MSIPLLYLSQDIELHEESLSHLQFWLERYECSDLLDCQRMMADDRFALRRHVRACKMSLKTAPKPVQMLTLLYGTIVRKDHVGSRPVSTFWNYQWYEVLHSTVFDDCDGNGQCSVGKHAVLIFDHKRFYSQFLLFTTQERSTLSQHLLQSSLFPPIAFIPWRWSKQCFLCLCRPWQDLRPEEASTFQVSHLASLSPKCHQA